MNFKELSTWVEAHPGESILIGGGIAIALLWLLGYFSSDTSGTAQDPLAAAYYAAEAQQAVVAGQIQQTTLTTAAATAQTGIQANAAVAINAAQQTAQTTINGQNADAATTINQSLGSDALLATQSNNATSLATAQSNNATASQINDSNNAASIWSQAMNTIIPTDQANNKGGAVVNFGPYGNFGIGTDVNTPSYLVGAGFTNKQAIAIIQSRLGLAPQTGNVPSPT